MNEKRRAEMARKIEAMARFRALQGAVVLEIGADLDSISARMLLDAGARKVIGTNVDARWTEAAEGGIERRRLDACAIGQAFEPGSIDIVFGVSVIEHVDGLDAFFEGARRVLAKDGLFYGHGGPIWSAAKGHHVIVKGASAEYRFGVPEKNPIPDWAHLVHTEASLAAMLAARGVPEADAELIAEFVYRSPELNRLGYRSLCARFDAAGFTLLERQENAFKPPPPELLAAIARGPWGGEERYDVSGVTFIARP
jgi:SAM-dependent methyltransferase